MDTLKSESRSDRRRANTRAALIGAARQLMATRDPLKVSIQEITETADVGFGSFYNHFDSKEEVFGAAVAEVLDTHGHMLDAITAGIEDPAEVFATAVRITARFPRTHPDLAAVMVRTGPDYLMGEKGLAPRALRDMEKAKSAGRFAYTDPLVALTCVGGALLGVVHVYRARPRSVDRAADELATNLLQMFGLPSAEARLIAHSKLPATPGRSTRR